MAFTAAGHASNMRCSYNADWLHRFPTGSIVTVVTAIASDIETNFHDSFTQQGDAFDSILVHGGLILHDFTIQLFYYRHST